jgi:hypothetical protein
MANNQIALLAQTPVFDSPYESQGKALKLRSLMNQSQEQDMDMQKRRQDIEDEAGIRDVYRNNSDPTERINALYRINPKAAMSAEKSQLDLSKVRGDVAETAAKTQEVQTKVVNLKMSQRRDMLNTVNDPQTAAQWVQGMFTDPDLAKVFTHGGDTIEQAIARIPKDPQGFADWKQKSQLGAEKLIQMTTPDANARLSAQTSTDNSLRSAASSRYSTDSAANNSRLSREQSADQHAAGLLQVGKAPSGYRFLPDGSMQAIPGGPADAKSSALAQQKALGASDVDSAVATLRDAYDRLEKGGGITSTERGALSNMAAASGSSGLGQAVGRAFGTQNQSARNDIAMTRPALLAALMKATGMSAKQMDSNAELKLWMATATDPTLDVESNRRALNAIERKYIASSSQPAPVNDENPRTISNDGDYNALPSGSMFIGPDGKTRRKP